MTEFNSKIKKNSRILKIFMFTFKENLNTTMVCDMNYIKNSIENIYVFNLRAICMCYQ